jgi:hypothetical protein
MMPAVASLVPLLRAFADEAEYLVFTEKYVGSCLAALTVAVGKDIAWKPLNHKILMYTRDNKKAVRIASVKVLHQLFNEVINCLLFLPLRLLLLWSQCANISVCSSFLLILI